VEPHNVALIAGDFTGTWGQGLVLSGLRFPSPRALPRRRDRLRGYDGASELGARRGLVVEVSRGRGAAWLVGARTRLDAAIDDDGRVSSIRSSGTHRTDGERRGANALEESLVGARAAVTPITGLRVGATFLRFRFDPPLAPGDPERQRFRFAGDELDVRAADVRLTAGRWVLGGEVALTSSGGRAALASARVRDGAVGVRFGFGWLSRAYWSPLGGGVPGFSSGANGLGGWVGAEYRIAPRLKPWVEILVAGRPWRPYSDELPGGFVTWSGGIEIPAGYLGDVEIELRERAARVGRGDPPESVVEASRRVRVTFRAAGEPPLSVYVERAASHARGVEEGSALALGARGEAALSQAVAIVVGVTQVARRGRARPLVQYEPPLPGSFGLVSLSEPGSRWYARLVAGLSARVGLSVRIGGGPGRGRTELGLSIDTRG
jgi:hypothetical protein